MPAPVAGPASNSAVRFSALTTVLMHVVPIGIIQVADYFSDIFVVLDFYERAQQTGDAKDALWWQVGLGFMISSVVAVYLLSMVVCCATCFGESRRLPLRHFFWVALLGPVNLHVLYLGVAQGNAKAAAEELKHAASGAGDLWRKYDAALERLDDAARSGVVEDYQEAMRAFKAAVQALESNTATKQYLKKLDEADLLNLLFVVSKTLETAIESLPLSVLTSASLLTGNTEQVALLWSSLALSVTSMAYGYFGACIKLQAKTLNADDDQDEKMIDPTFGKQPKIFLAILVQTVFTVGAMGLCYASEPLIGATAYFLPFSILFIFFACCCPIGTIAALYASVQDEQKLCGKVFGCFVFLCFAAPFLAIFCAAVSAQTAAVDLFLMISPSVISTVGTNCVIVPFAFVRRALLYTMIFWPLFKMAETATLTATVNDTNELDTMLNATNDTAVDFGDLEHGDFLTFAFVSGGADLMATLYLLYTLHLCCCTPKRGRAAAEGAPIGVQQFASDGTHSVETDLVEAVQRHAQRAVDGTTGHLHAALDALLPCADALLVRARDGSLTSEEKQAIRKAVNVYKPSETGETESSLCDSLNHVNRRTLVPEPASASSARQSYEHPMRASRLVFGLMASIWTTVPSFFGTKVEGTNFDLSHDAERCTYFVSHSWRDSGRKKLQMLREFLCLQAMLGRALVVLPLTACFFIPLGFALESSPWVGAPWWILPAIPAGVLALLLLWMLLSVMGCMPANTVPWAFSTKTLWIDKLCIDQSTPETTAAGVAGFSRFLSKCDRMVALISTSYFSRLWCVYELAVFTRDNGMHLPGAASGKLLLLSLDWPSSLNPLKRTRLSEHEKQLITTFSCRNADCFMPRGVPVCGSNPEKQIVCLICYSHACGPHDGTDRATVLAAIREKFGSEAAFDQFVRTHLPAVLERSKREYSSNLLNVAADALERSFGV